MARFRFFSPDLDADTTLVVDGVVEGYRSLSHWPGNTTPDVVKHDLSTGIVLAWAKLPEAEQTALTGQVDVVSNHHYDTDGVLSVFSFLRPEEALAREKSLLDTAATGDFGVWRGAEALALELTIMAMSRGDLPDSPLHAVQAAATSSVQRWERAYLWLIDALPDLLDTPDRYANLWHARHDEVSQEIADLARGDDVDVVHHADIDLAVVTRQAPITKYGLAQLAGDRSRVLLVVPDGPGWRYRFLFRIESWFDLARPAPPPRVPLMGAIETLAAIETNAAATWWATPLDTPIAALGFGSPDRAGETFFEDPDVAQDAISSIEPGRVVAALTDALRR